MEINILCHCSIICCFIYFRPNLSITTQRIKLNNKTTNIALIDSNVDSNIAVAQQTMNTIKQGSKNYNVTNNMNNIVPFISDGKINYLANNSTNTGIVVLDNNYQSIATSGFYHWFVNLLYKKKSRKKNDEPSKPKK